VAGAYQGGGRVAGIDTKGTAGRVGNVDISTQGAAFNCGYCGRVKKQLPILPTTIWIYAAAGAKKQRNCGQLEMSTPISTPLSVKLHYL
jgi:hypothetical protein